MRFLRNSNWGVSGAPKNIYIFYFFFFCVFLPLPYHRPVEIIRESRPNGAKIKKSSENRSPPKRFDFHFGVSASALIIFTNGNDRFWVPLPKNVFFIKNRQKVDFGSFWVFLLVVILSIWAILGFFGPGWAPAWRLLKSSGSGSAPAWPRLGSGLAPG